MSQTLPQGVELVDRSRPGGMPWYDIKANGRLAGECWRTHGRWCVSSYLVWPVGYSQPSQPTPSATLCEASTKLAALAEAHAKLPAINGNTQPACSEPANVDYPRMVYAGLDGDGRAVYEREY